MGAIDTMTFKSGNGVAVRLPQELGIAANFPVKLERIGNTVIMRPAADDIEAKQKWLNVLAKLDAIGVVDEIGERMAVDVPDRVGS